MDAELLYIAGYLDGDGSFYARRRLNSRGYAFYEYNVDACSTNPNIIQILHTTFGGRIKTKHLDNPNKNLKALYSWRVSMMSAINCASRVLPFLKEKHFDASILVKMQPIVGLEGKGSLFKELKTYREREQYVNEKTVEHLRMIDKIGNPNQEDYAYLSGFIDAECSLVISLKKYNKLSKGSASLCLGNTKPEVFYWLMQTFGGSVSLSRKRLKNPKCRNQVYWAISGNALLPILPNILPHLKHKKPICEKLIEFLSTECPIQRQGIAEQTRVLNFNGLNNV